MSELNNKIRTLIESKDVEELSPTEKELVLGEMTIQAYKARRKSLLSAQALLREERSQLQPDPAVLSMLQNRLKDEQDTVVVIPLWQRIVHSKVPTYWVAVAAILAIAFVAFWPKPDPIQTVKYVDRQVPVYATVYDTVYLENDRPINRVVVENVVRPNRAVSEVINTLEIVDPGVVVVPQVPDIKDIEQSYGNQPISNDELNQFRVSL